MWATVALVLPLLREAPWELMGLLSAGGALAVAICVIRGMRQRVVSLALALLLGIGAGCMAAGLGAADVRSASDALMGETCQWSCELADDARPSSFGCQATARAVADNGARALVRLWLPASGASLLCGDTVAVSGALKAPAEASAERFWAGGMAGTLTADEGGVRKARKADGVAAWRRQALEAIGQQGGSGCEVLQALVCGYRVPIQESGLYEQFKAVGLAHIVAVSGAHLSIVSMLVALGLRALRVPFKVSGALMGLFLLGYVLFAGVPVSALRAALMAASGVVALMAGRRGSALSALGLCLVVFIGLSPFCALSVSFALSAASTLGIVLFAPLIASWVPAASRPVREYLVGPLAMTGAAGVAVLPYGAALFSQVPLLGPVAGAATAPLFALGCTTAFACVVGALAVPPASGALLAVAQLAVAPLQAVVGALARLPATCLPADVEAAPMVLLSLATGAVLWAWWPRMTARGAAGAASVVAILLAAALVVPGAWWRDEIVMLDVGQGDALLIRSQGRSLLVDTGNQDARLKEALARQGVRHLDAVAVTHGDDDHCGSLDALRTVAVVDSALVAADTLACGCSSCEGLLEALGTCTGQPARGMRPGDTVVCGRFALTVVWPRAFVDGGGNTDSLCLLCQWDGNGDGAFEWSALLCGDAEAEELSAMAKMLPASGVDVLKVGHHGSRESLNAQVMERLRPAVALVSAGKGNRYGHPSVEACSLLEEAGCEVRRTDREGDVAVVLSMEKLAVRSQLESEGG